MELSSCIAKVSARLLWGQMALASLVAISGPKKVSIFRARPFQCPSK